MVAFESVAMSLWLYLYIFGACGLLGLLNFKPSWCNLNIQLWKRYWKVVVNLLLAFFAMFNSVWTIALGVFNTVATNMKPPQEEATLPVTRPPNNFKCDPRAEGLAFSLLTVVALSYCYWQVVWFFTVPHRLEHCPVAISGLPGSYHNEQLGTVPGFNQQLPCFIDSSVPTYRVTLGSEEDFGNLTANLDIYQGYFKATMPSSSLVITIQYECFNILYRCDVEFYPVSHAKREVMAEHKLQEIPPQKHQNPALAFAVGIVSFALLAVLVFFCMACVLAVAVCLCCSLVVVPTKVQQDQFDLKQIL
jgi:hypothetical protein